MLECCQHEGLDAAVGSGVGVGVRPDTDLDAAPSLALPKLRGRAFPPTPLLPRRPAAPPLRPPPPEPLRKPAEPIGTRGRPARPPGDWHPRPGPRAPIGSRSLEDSAMRRQRPFGKAGRGKGRWDWQARSSAPSASQA